MCQANFLAMTMTACLLRPSRLLLLGSQGGVSSLEASPDSMDHWNRYTKLGPFFATSSFDHNFDQMTIKHSLCMQKVH